MYGYGFGYGFKSYGVGIGKELAEAYEIRVLADGGVVENLSCVIAALNKLDKI